MAELSQIVSYCFNTAPRRQDQSAKIYLLPKVAIGVRLQAVGEGGAISRRLPMPANYQNK
jgi:hypothetical protein